MASKKKLPAPSFMPPELVALRAWISGERELCEEDLRRIAKKLRAISPSGRSN